MAVPKAYLAAVAAASTKYNVPAELLAAQIQAESGWNPNAKSPMGATGISQFMPGTAKGFGIDPTNPLESIDAQGKMMGRLIKSYGGNQDKALAAYNAGAGNVAKYGGVPPFKETHDYINRIHSYESNYPGLKSNHVAGLSPDAVNRANTYANLAGIVPTGSQTAPKRSLQTIDPTASTGGYDASQALIGYLIKQSSPAHGSNDPTGDLMSMLSAEQQATTNAQATQFSRGAKATPTVATPTTSPLQPGRLIGDKKYKVIGQPHQGTHNLGNWESDNAIDIAAPVGTPIYADANGTIGSQIGALNSSAPTMAGLRVHVISKNNEAYYAHLSRLVVKAGQTVKKGQLIGYSGSANGTAHLHFSVKSGNPNDYYK